MVETQSDMAIVPGAARPRVSVVVPHFHDLEGLAACLDALGRQTWPEDRLEIIVADNASPEGAAAVEAVIAGRARLVVVTERGAGPARNGGVGAATGDILAFTDSDCLPGPGWLEAGAGALGDNDVVGGRMTVKVDDPGRPTPEEAFELVFAFDNEAYVKRKGFSVSANLFCRRPVFERVGGFRVGVPEDLEWCRRAVAAGYTLGYAAEAVVAHPARKTQADILKKWRRLNLEAYVLCVARPGGRLIWLARALAMPASAVVHTPKVLGSSALAGLDQKLAALRVLFGLRAWRGANAMALLATDGRG